MRVDRIQKEILAERCFVTEKTPVIIKNVDFNGIQTYRDGPKIDIENIKPGMSLFIPCESENLLTGKKSNVGFQIGRVMDVDIDRKNMVIESRGFMFSTIDFSKEFMYMRETARKEKAMLARDCIDRGKTPVFIKDIEYRGLRNETPGVRYGELIKPNEIHKDMIVGFECMYKKAEDEEYVHGYCRTGQIKGFSMKGGELFTIESKDTMFAAIDFSKEYEILELEKTKTFEFGR